MIPEGNRRIIERRETPSVHRASVKWVRKIIVRPLLTNITPSPRTNSISILRLATLSLTQYIVVVIVASSYPNGRRSIHLLLEPIHHHDSLFNVAHY
jgi:hypothetical protein